MSRRKSLSEVLVELGHLSAEQLSEIRKNIQQRPGSRLGERAVELGMLTERQLCEAVAKQFNLQMVPDDRVQRLKISPEALGRLPPTLIRQRLVIPTFMDAEQSMLSLLVADPTDLPALKAAQEFTGTSRLRLFVATRSAIKALADQLLPEEEPTGSIPTPAPDVTGPIVRSEPTPIGRTLVLEPDPARLDALRAIEKAEGGESTFVSDDSHVSRMLEEGGFDRLIYRTELQDKVDARLRDWRQVRPGLEATAVEGYAPSSARPSADTRESDFLLRLVEFTLLAGETKNMDARARCRRAVHLAREVARVRELRDERRDTLIICALFLYLDQLSIVSGMVSDETTDMRRARRFELALAVMEPLEPPFDIAGALNGVERRMIDREAPRDNVVAEILFTLKAVIDKGAADIADAASLLGADAAKHDAEVLAAFSTVLRREQLLGRLARESSGGGGSTVVVAEREASLVTAIESRLAQAGYEVIAVADGAAALERVNTLKPAAVLANLRLPRRDGLSLLLEIKQNEETANIPVIILADRADGPTISRALDFGAEDVLEKPVNLQVLMARLRRAAGRPKRTRASGIVGRLADLNLLDLLQTLHLGNKAAEVTVTAPSGRGSINLYDGQLVAATYGRSQGEDALYELAALTDGLFEVRFGASPPVPNIGMPTDQLFLEAARRLDETRVDL